MTIYSHRLGEAVGSGLVYASPIAEGPTIIKGASWTAGAGFSAQLFVNIGGVDYNFDAIDNTAGPSTLYGVFHRLWCVLEPGDSLELGSGTGGCVVTVFGQHFNQP